MAAERWLPLADNPDYAISDRGAVASLKGGRRRLLQLFEVKGYLRFASFLHGSQIVRMVHREVLLAFVGEPPKGKPWALHRDDNSKNNVLENLYWGSASENMHDAFKNGGRDRHQNAGERHGNAKLTEDAVRQIRERVSRGEMQKDLAREFGVSKTAICVIVKRQYWSHV